MVLVDIVIASFDDIVGSEDDWDDARYASKCSKNSLKCVLILLNGNRLPFFLMFEIKNNCILFSGLSIRTMRSSDSSAAVSTSSGDTDTMSNMSDKKMFNHDSFFKKGSSKKHPK